MVKHLNNIFVNDVARNLESDKMSERYKRKFLSTAYADAAQQIRDYLHQMGILQLRSSHF